MNHVPQLPGSTAKKSHEARLHSRSRTRVTCARRCDVITDANRTDPFLNKLWGNGIDITSGRQAPYPISSHIVVRNNRVWNFSGAGISAIRSDWITVENNEVFNNASRSPWDTSGISFYQLRDETDADSANASLVKNVIRGNMIYGNRNDVGFRGINYNACDAETAPTDGNGIIIDDLLNTQNAAEPGYNKRPHQGRTLVDNNVSHHNGGRGINVYSSRRVDVVNNTTFHNAQKAVPENSLSEVSSVDTQDVTYMNNIVAAKPGGKLVTLYQASNTTYTYNLFSGGASSDLTPDPTNIVGPDPAFSNAAGNDYRLTARSPAIDRGTAQARNASAPPNDYDGVSRPQGGGVDLGAFESSFQTTNTTTTAPPTTTALPIPPSTTAPTTTTPTPTTPTPTTTPAPTTTTPTPTTTPAPTTTTPTPSNSPVASGIYRITNACSGRPLTLEMQDPGPWGNVIAGRRSESMRWQVDAQPDGRIQLRMAGTDRVVGTAYGETKPGTNVEL